MKAAFPEPKIVWRGGRPVSVILAIKDYEELLERADLPADVVVLNRALRKLAGRSAR